MKKNCKQIKEISSRPSLKSRKHSVSFISSKNHANKSQYCNYNTACMTKARNSSKRKDKRRKSRGAYEERKKSKANRIQVSFDEHLDSAMNDPQYTNVIIRNPSSGRHRDLVQSTEKLQTEIKYLHSRLEDEMKRRKKAEQDRDCLIGSLDDMTRQAKSLEKTLRDFESENIDLYEKLK